MLPSTVFKQPITFRPKAAIVTMYRWRSVHHNAVSRSEFLLVVDNLVEKVYRFQSFKTDLGEGCT